MCGLLGLPDNDEDRPQWKQKSHIGHPCFEFWETML